MNINLNKYLSHYDAIKNMVNTSKEISRDLTKYSAASGTPLIAVLYFAKHASNSNDYDEDIERIKKFYGYGDIGELDLKNE